MISEPVIDFWVVVKLFSVFQCLFFSALILSSKTENHKAQKFLVMFLLVFALLETDEVSFHSRYIFQIPFLTGIVDPLAICLGPLIYLYTVSLTDKTFTFTNKHLGYFLPALALYILWLPVYDSSNEQKINFLIEVFYENGNIFEVDYPYNLFFITVCAAVTYAFVFLSMSLLKLYKFKKRLKQFYSSIDAFNLKWLQLLLILLSVIWLFSFLSIFISSRAFYIIDFIVFPLFIFLISYYDIRQKRIPVMESILNNIRKEETLPDSIETDSKLQTVKYAKSELSEEVAEELNTRLLFLIDHEKVYLKNDLSLQELADKMETSTHNLSQFLNEKLNQSFYDFINFHRVKEVKQRLASEEFKNLKILAIAFDSGFNSKTTFNSTFKKHSGQSPTEYRNTLKSAKKDEI